MFTLKQLQFTLAIKLLYGMIAIISLCTIGISIKHVGNEFIALFVVGNVCLMGFGLIGMGVLLNSEWNCDFDVHDIYIFASMGLIVLALTHVVCIYHARRNITPTKHVTFTPVLFPIPLIEDLQ